jgi:solute carrier family 35
VKFYSLIFLHIYHKSQTFSYGIFQQLIEICNFLFCSDITEMKTSSAFVGLSIAFIYGCCSASMAFANKAVLTTYRFDYPFFLVTCQMLFSVIVLEALRFTGKTALESFTIARGRMFLLPSACYAANCVLSLSALGDMNIPMYGLIKRCSPVAILLLGTTVLRKPLPSWPTCISVVMITAGCLTAGTFSFAYSCGLLK